MQALVAISSNVRTLSEAAASSHRFADCHKLFCFATASFPAYICQRNTLILKNRSWLIRGRNLLSARSEPVEGGVGDPAFGEFRGMRANSNVMTHNHRAGGEANCPDGSLVKQAVRSGRINILQREIIAGQKKTPGEARVRTRDNKSSSRGNCRPRCGAIDAPLRRLGKLGVDTSF
ncbi:hypothetical protein CEXT_48331 [Caerostris extrusa]|uniref:Uncharacterized protein n=1 Tax=Caerostris extrusa TaxID=172846 RepID=A0AAV4N122_CAEEX|nr:hypothetical protein CEXT_48331 [Caerostris extrusa]